MELAFLQKMRLLQLSRLYSLVKVEHSVVDLYKSTTPKYSLPVYILSLVLV